MGAKIVNDDTFGYVPLIPSGEWILNITITKIINNSEVEILTWSEFYEVKARGALEFWDVIKDKLKK